MQPSSVADRQRRAHVRAAIVGGDDAGGRVGEQDVQVAARDTRRSAPRGQVGHVARARSPEFDGDGRGRGSCRHRPGDETAPVGTTGAVERGGAGSVDRRRAAEAGRGRGGRAAAWPERRGAASPIVVRSGISLRARAATKARIVVTTPIWKVAVTAIVNASWMPADDRRDQRLDHGAEGGRHECSGSGRPGRRRHPRGRPAPRSRPRELIDRLRRQPGGVSWTGISSTAGSRRSCR